MNYGKFRSIGEIKKNEKAKKAFPLIEKVVRQNKKAGFEARWNIYTKFIKPLSVRIRISHIRIARICAHIRIRIHIRISHSVVGAHIRVAHIHVAVCRRNDGVRVAVRNNRSVIAVGSCGIGRIDHTV